MQQSSSGGALHTARCGTAATAAVTQTLQTQLILSVQWMRLLQCVVMLPLQSLMSTEYAFTNCCQAKISVSGHDALAKVVISLTTHLASKLLRVESKIAAQRVLWCWWHVGGIKLN